ncbi:hypothetical protein CLV46_2499 [Diaminobutyricimonas aerilata]|uniref:Ig-like domain-containing protein n=1 Tax=Diaminobutyricimonas aerilata TaxID=1162967 RepID=A0A2M9CM00_9MICO|nr:hypothetical protein [Diaminobutyricimonas aerilata]PJJ72920.1 hypothetical protein CLV46_2499 [Diaminobutyricimonas aerilata]
MNTRISSRRVAAGAATGAILLSLVYGGAAVADEIGPAAEQAPVSTDAPAAAVAQPAATDAPVEAPTQPTAEPTTGPTKQAPVEPARPAADPASAATPAPAEPEVATSQPIALADPDTTAPSIIVEVPPASPRGWYTGAVKITLAAGDPGNNLRGIVYSIDGGPEHWIVGPGGAATIETGGEHVFSAYAVDWADNRSAVATSAVNIDLAAPYVATFSQPQDSVYPLDFEVSLGYLCADDLSGVDSCYDEDRLEGMLDTSTVGEHTVDVMARDVAGNETVIPFRYSVVDDDITAPAITAVASGPHTNDEWFTGETRVEFQVHDTTEEGVSITYQVPGRWPTTVRDTRAATLIDTDGVFDITYYAEDAAGNRSEQQTITVRRDTVVPVIAHAAHDASGAPVGNGAVVAQNAEIEFGYECTDTTSGVAECSSEVQSGELLDTRDLGGHSVLLTSTDAAGNEVSVIFDYTVEEVVDPVDPGNGGEEPTDPIGGAPDQPGTAQPTPAVVTPARSTTSDDDRLASTGVEQVTPLGVLTAGMLAVGSALIAIGLRRRSAR